MACCLDVTSHLRWSARQSGTVFEFRPRPWPQTPPACLSQGRVATVRYPTHEHLCPETWVRLPRCPLQLTGSVFLQAAARFRVKQGLDFSNSPEKLL